MTELPFQWKKKTGITIQDKHDKSLLKGRGAKKDTLPSVQIAEEKLFFGECLLRPEVSDHDQAVPQVTVGPALHNNSPKLFASVQEIKEYGYYSVGVRSVAKMSFTFTDKCLLFFRFYCRGCVFSHEIQTKE